MKGYLLDTDIVVFFLRGNKDITQKMATLDASEIYISEVTIAELEYGNRCSGRYEENKELVSMFLSKINVVPFMDAVSYYAKERYRLRKIGQPIADFDLLIGCTSVSKGLKMVTNNVIHFSHIDNIDIENWKE